MVKKHFILLQILICSAVRSRSWRVRQLLSILWHIVCICYVFLCEHPKYVVGNVMYLVLLSLNFRFIKKNKKNFTLQYTLQKLLLLDDYFMTSLTFSDLREGLILGAMIFRDNTGERMAEPMTLDIVSTCLITKQLTSPPLSSYIHKVFIHSIHRMHFLVGPLEYILNIFELLSKHQIRDACFIDRNSRTSSYILSDTSEYFIRLNTLQHCTVLSDHNIRSPTVHCVQFNCTNRHLTMYNFVQFCVLFVQLKLYKI